MPDPAAICGNDLNSEDKNRSDTEYSLPVRPVILSGGKGNRLWPLSRENYPKQFRALFSERSLLQETVLRTGFPGFLPFFLICHQDHRFQVGAQLQEIGAVGGKIILEPTGKDSGPAIALAAFLAAEEDPEQILWITPTDAFINHPAELQQDLKQAAGLAKSGKIVTFGIPPTYPETGYGYLEAGENIPPCPTAFEVRRFTEKPDKAQAGHFYQSGKYFWNSGMFVGKASVFLEEFQKFSPEITHFVGQAVKERQTDQDFIRPDPVFFTKTPAISFDYAIAEKTDKAALIKARFTWTDVGSFEKLWDILPKNPDGNVLLGDSLATDSKNCLIRSEEGMLTVALDVENLTVISTNDTVLVARHGSSAKIKQIVNRLRLENREEVLNFSKVERPWGSYETLTKGAKFQVKRIMVNPQSCLSLQKHRHRAEHWVVVKGQASVTRNEEIFVLQENESTYIPGETLHRLCNLTDSPLIVIEVQSGEYLGEDDIIRFDDHYGRP